MLQGATIYVQIQWQIYQDLDYSCQHHKRTGSSCGYSNYDTEIISYIGHTQAGQLKPEMVS